VNKKRPSFGRRRVGPPEADPYIPAVRIVWSTGFLLCTSLEIGLITGHLPSDLLQLIPGERGDKDPSAGFALVYEVWHDE
jgi:hypothetical protein